MAASTPLHGRVALVTGGSRGIGAAIARELAGAGATLALNYRSDEAAARDVAAALGDGTSIWQADVSDCDQGAELVERVVEHHGRLDIVVLNAGVWRGGRIDAIDPADWSTVLDTSLSGAFHVLRAAAGPLRGSDAGRVVVISSVVGLVGFPGDAAYGAAKAGLLGLVRSLAKELGGDGVTVNAVAPGFIETDMTSEVSEGSRERMLSRAALRRPGEPADVATAVRYLAVDGGYVTGQTLVVDGGFSL
jgi:3-oxoacyl-[acyl-carrier protein] reductase